MVAVPQSILCSTMGSVNANTHLYNTCQMNVPDWLWKGLTFSAAGRGPYWYFRFHEDGEQRKIYLGKADDPDGQVIGEKEDYTR